MKLILVAFIIAIVAFAYLVYRVGWKEAAAAAGALFAGIAGAIAAFADKF